MSEKVRFMLEGDVVAVTREEIDNIESMFVPGGDTTGSQITTEDIDEVLNDGDISDNEHGSSIPSDIPKDYEGTITNQEIQDVINN